MARVRGVMGGVRGVMGSVRGVMVRYRSTCLEGIRMVIGVHCGTWQNKWGLVIGKGKGGGGYCGIR